MGEYQAHNTPLELALRALVQEHGRYVYRETEMVSNFLTKKRIVSKQVKHVELVLTESSILRYLAQMDDGLSAVECNNILLSAEATGLSDHTIRETVSALLFGLGVPQLLKKADILRESGSAEISWDLYVPPEVYTGSLKTIENKISEEMSLEKEEYTQLNQFIRAGVPKACMLMGRLMLKSPGRDNVRRGLEYLQYAADHGEVEAVALLADYYVDKNGMKAQKLYTMPGAMAMDDRRKRKYLALEKKRKARWHQLLMMVGVFVLVEAVILLIAGTTVAGTLAAARNVCVVVSLLNLVWLGVRYAMDRYRDLYLEGIPMTLSMFAYIMFVIWWR